MNAGDSTRIGQDIPSRVRLAVLGSPISHSRSPRLHRACYSLLGRIDLQYSAIDVSAGQLLGFWAALDANWLGLSLTMPLKTTVLPLLAALDGYAARTAAVNTVLFTDQGPVGFNTDVVGFLEVLKAMVPRFESDRVDHREHARALVLGAGATASSALCALAELGCADVTVAARRAESVADLAQRFAELDITAVQLPGQGGVDPRTSGAWNRLGAVDVVINTLPVDAASPQLLNIVRDLAAHNAGTFIDALYEPSPPPLLDAWRRGGGSGTDGLALLREQGLAQVLIFTGETVDSATLTSLRACTDAAVNSPA